MDFIRINRAVTAPHIRPINIFLMNFADSTETTVEFAADDIGPDSVIQPLFSALHGLN
jgi:hypothetical protein